MIDKNSLCPFCNNKLLTYKTFSVGLDIMYNKFICNKEDHEFVYNTHLHTFKLTTEHLVIACEKENNKKTYYAHTLVKSKGKFGPTLKIKGRQFDLEPFEFYQSKQILDRFNKLLIFT